MRLHRDEIELLVVHHSASPLSTTPEDIRRWHVEENGWDDIGYHWLVTALGTVVPARSPAYEGAHVRGYNRGTVGICLIGDNTTSDHAWLPEQVFALQKHWAACRAVYGNDLDVAGHRDLASGTECPGLDVRALLLGPNAPPSQVA